MNQMGKQIQRIDRSTMDNVYHVSEDCQAIQETMMKHESKWQVDSRYMGNQTKISETIRSTLMDWII